MNFKNSSSYSTRFTLSHPPPLLFLDFCLKYFGSVALLPSNSILFPMQFIWFGELFWQHFSSVYLQNPLRLPSPSFSAQEHGGYFFDLANMSPFSVPEHGGYLFGLANMSLSAVPEHGGYLFNLAKLSPYLSRNIAATYLVWLTCPS